MGPLSSSPYSHIDLCTIGSEGSPHQDGSIEILRSSNRPFVQDLCAIHHHHHQQQQRAQLCLKFEGATAAAPGGTPLMAKLGHPTPSNNVENIISVILLGIIIIIAIIVQRLREKLIRIKSCFAEKLIGTGWFFSSFVLPGFL